MRSLENEEIKGTPDNGVLFFQSFDGKAHYDGWKTTSLSNYSGIWKIQTPPAPRTDIFEKMLVQTSQDLYSAISTLLPNPISYENKPFVLQFEVRGFKNITCSGAYIKLFADPHFNQETFSNETKQFLMFGPDVCHKKRIVQFAFYHENPTTHTKIEKSLIDPPTAFKDDLNHLYTLIIRPDGTYSILIDNKTVKKGKFIDSFHPSIIPPKQIPDPSSHKPKDWDSRKFIEDDSYQRKSPKSEVQFIPDPTKLNPPKGWLINEPPYIEDKQYTRPHNWDDELLGEWKPPLIANPKCVVGCGQYHPPLVANPDYVDTTEKRMIPNPNYKGEWKAPIIDNPEYFVDLTPYHFPTFYAMGFELLSSDGQIGFNNILIANDEKEVLRWNSKFWESRKKTQAKTLYDMQQAKIPLEIRNKMTPKLNSKNIGVLQGLFHMFSENYYYMLVTEPQISLLLTLAFIVVVFIFGVFCCDQICCGEIDIEDDEDQNTKEVKTE